MSIVPIRHSCPVDNVVSDWHAKLVSTEPKTSQRKGRVTAEVRRRQKAGRIVLRALQEKGYTIRSFARSIKVEPSTVSRWCAGKRFPGRTKLRILQEKLGVNPADLV